MASEARHRLGYKITDWKVCVTTGWVAWPLVGHATPDKSAVVVRQKITLPAHSIEPLPSNWLVLTYRSGLSILPLFGFKAGEDACGTFPEVEGMKSILLGVLSLMGFFIGPVQAQVELRYRWNTGDVFILRKVLQMEGTLQSGDRSPLEIREKAGVRKKITVQKVDNLGNAQLLAALLTVSGTKEVNGRESRYFLSEDQMKLDDLLVWQRSENETNPNPKIENKISDLFKPWIAWSAPRGQINTPTQPDAIRQGTSQSDLFSLFGIGQEGWLIFPDDPVSEGSTWTDQTNPVIRSATMEYQKKTEYQLQNLRSEDNQEIATIAFDQEEQSRNLPFSFRPYQTDQSEVTQVEYLENRQIFMGTVDLDIAKGIVLRCDCEGNAFLRYRQKESFFSPSQPEVIEYRWNSIRMSTEWEKVE